VSLLLERLAAALPHHPAALPGAPIVCRGCGCDDTNAWLDGAGQACSWTLLDIETPTGVCSSCAVRAGWHPVVLSAIGRRGPLEDYVCMGLERYVADVIGDDAGDLAAA